MGKNFSLPWDAREIQSPQSRIRAVVRRLYHCVRVVVEVMGWAWLSLLQPPNAIESHPPFPSLRWSCGHRHRYPGLREVYEEDIDFF